MYVVAVPVVLYYAIYGGPLVEPGLNRVKAQCRLATEVGNPGFGVCRVLEEGSGLALRHREDSNGFLLFLLCDAYIELVVWCSSKGQ